MISESIKEWLIANGLSKQQASSTTAEIIMSVVTPEDQRLALANTIEVVNEMRRTYNALCSDYRALSSKMSETLAMIEAFDEIGAPTDEKARNAIALYTAISKIGTTEQASYITYAYLGGEARQVITPDFSDRLVPPNEHAVQAKRII